jgi:hypothetical protein
VGPMKACGISSRLGEVQFQLLTLGSSWGWWPAVPPLLPQDALLLMKETPSTHCLRGWVGPRAGLGALKKRQNLWSNWKSNHIFWDIQPTFWSLYWLSYPRRVLNAVVYVNCDSMFRKRDDVSVHWCELCFSMDRCIVCVVDLHFC